LNTTRLGALKFASTFCEEIGHIALDTGIAGDEVRKGGLLVAQRRFKPLWVP
jgi:hypothetical protein